MDDNDMRAKAVSQSKKTPTSMNIDENLWDRVKIRAIKEKRTATEIVEEVLYNYLEKEDG